jgi:site-specific DNA-cytosine methylase
MADLYGNASVGFCKRETPQAIMERKVSQRDTYIIYKAKGKTARTKMLCGRYASIIRGWNNDGAIRTVYNITVDGEHSYIVNGIAVHNCQGFSVAGKQGGLADPRSALCLAYCRLLETMRPRWFVWENVPGVFSTNGGEDFRAFLRKIDEIGYSCAWRVLDAQYVRVDGYPRAIPQRRRRVFVVGHLGADWRYPASGYSAAQNQGARICRKC